MDKQEMFWIVPLSTKQKSLDFYFNFNDESGAAGHSPSTGRRGHSATKPGRVDVGEATAAAGLRDLFEQAFDALVFRHMVTPQFSY
jgi:hypothetical protein